MGLIFWLASLVIGGFIIGILARLVVKPVNRPGFWETVLYGWGGWLLGSIIAAVAFLGSAPWVFKLATEVGAAALLIALMGRRRARTTRV